MRINIIIPGKTVLDQQVHKITAPGTEGSFQILPRHVDVVSSLKPGILSVFFNDTINYYAINHGVLVKRADTVYVSCLQAIKGDSLETISKTVADNFKVLDEKEKKINEVLVKLEADTLKMFMEID